MVSILLKTVKLESYLKHLTTMELSDPYYWLRNVIFLNNFFWVFAWKERGKRPHCEDIETIGKMDIRNENYSFFIYITYDSLSILPIINKVEKEWKLFIIYITYDSLSILPIINKVYKEWKLFILYPGE